ncbi:MAG: hypothetical protein WBX25_10275 [Rhodomicrobium sp.]
MISHRWERTLLILALALAIGILAVRIYYDVTEEDAPRDDLRYGFHNKN